MGPALVNITRCVESAGAQLVVLPESATTGFTPGCTPGELWDLVTELPGGVIEPIQACARDLAVHVCVGPLNEGPSAASSTTPAVCWDPTAA